MRHRVLILGLALLLSACVEQGDYRYPSPPYANPYAGSGPKTYAQPAHTQATGPYSASRPQEAFYNALRSYCGQAFEGRVVTNDEEDAAMRRQRLVLDIRDCSARDIRMPFHQGENRSRTWIVAKRLGGLTLKHDHRLRNGQSEPVTLYGGETLNAGSSIRQEFPADAYSSELFFKNGRPQSAQNIWALEIIPGRVIAYELRRTGRYLRIEFDVRRPLGPQRRPWGER